MYLNKNSKNAKCKKIKGSLYFVRKNKNYPNTPTNINTESMKNLTHKHCLPSLTVSLTSPVIIPERKKSYART